jgi:ferredoxin-NADP reductase/MOSC domain-containing protein YiiM
MARLLSVNVGLPRDVAWKGRIVHTAIWKGPVQGRCRVGRLNLAGDGQGDLAGHGGEQRAVFVYQIESYRYWQEQLRRTDFVHGQFGENFTIEGLPDDQVCIGDRYRIGSALFEVTQPRVTCYRVGIRMSEPRMPALLTSSGRPGFYFRVLQEGDVGTDDDIVKVGESATERMTIAEINALLYSSHHDRDRLERALRIEALSPGWRGSFQALLAQPDGRGGNGNAGLAPAAAAHPAAPGFRTLVVTAIDHESADVLSLTMRRRDGEPLPTALPGQYVVLRLPRRDGGAPLFRSYSLSGPASTERYRISVKIEAHGLAGAYLQRVHVGDAIEVSAPRGSFVLDADDRPVVLISAGIGATPVLAMLHALAATRSTRPVWWLHGARDREHHAFADEVRALVRALPHGRDYVCYSAPGAQDTMPRDFDARGHLSAAVFTEVGLPRDADVYLCGPTRFMAEMKEALAAIGIAPARMHVELFNGSESLMPGVVEAPTRAPHLPEGEAGTGPVVSFARSGIAARWKASAYQSLLELAEACDVPVRWSCRTGVCHNCESGLVSGAVSYGPDPLDPPADGNLLVCCSQPTGDLVIDL